MPLFRLDGATYCLELQVARRMTTWPQNSIPISRKHSGISSTHVASPLHPPKPYSWTRSKDSHRFARTVCWFKVRHWCAARSCAAQGQLHDGRAWCTGAVKCWLVGRVVSTRKRKHHAPNLRALWLLRDKNMHTYGVKAPPRVFYVPVPALSGFSAHELGHTLLARLAA